MKFIWRNILKIKSIRHALITHLRSEYFHELDFSFPIGNEYWANLWENDSYDSFSEIFIQQEYAHYIPQKPISRILDLGANYGYFSLWLESKYPESNLRVLMVEPSPNCSRSLENLVSMKKLAGRFMYMQNCIGLKNREQVPFFVRSHMAGSIYSNSKAEKPVMIENLSEVELMQKFPPPYNMIKCDIEGSEWEFLNNYQNILKKTEFLLLEWHSWHTGGGGLDQILHILSSINYSVVRSSSASAATGSLGKVGLILAKNQAYGPS